MQQANEQPANTRRQRIMVAGVGNMFLKDDGFGHAVVKKLMEKKLPEGVEVKDFGTGGLKLAYDLMTGYNYLIIVDASSRGEKPGTLYLIEPREEEVNADLEQGGPIDPHNADPSTVLRFVKSFGAWPEKVLILAVNPKQSMTLKLV
jgi:hydrogenase maturation protease